MPLYSILLLWGAMISGYLGFNQECLLFGQNGVVSNPVWSLVGVKISTI